MSFTWASGSPGFITIITRLRISCRTEATCWRSSGPSREGVTMASCPCLCDAPCSLPRRRAKRLHQTPGLQRSDALGTREPGLHPVAERHIDGLAVRGVVTAEAGAD